MLKQATYRFKKSEATLQTNVQPDQGVYRFNDLAQNTDIKENLDQLWDAHTRKPKVTGDESSQGLVFQEGITG